MFEGREQSLSEFVEQWTTDSDALDDLMDAVEEMADTFAEEGRQGWRVSVIAYKNDDGAIEFDYRTTREF